MTSILSHKLSTSRDLKRHVELSQALLRDIKKLKPDLLEMLC
jgi:hypothetical protein